MSMSFEYRALDLLAEYETRFQYVPSMFFNHIEATTNYEVAGSFAQLVDALCKDASLNMGSSLADDEFAARLGELTERELHVIKLLGDLGAWTGLTRSVFSYFVTRQRLLEDERAWIRFTKLVDEEISIRAC